MHITTRSYRDGRVIDKDFPLAELSQRLKDDTTTLWVDLDDVEPMTLDDIAEELHLHPLAVEDVLGSHERAKMVRYPTHLFLTLYAVRAPEDSTKHMERREIGIFVTRNVVVTVRRNASFDIDRAREAWEAQPTLLAEGAVSILWAIIDLTVDSHFDTIQTLDERLAELEEQLFAEDNDDDNIRHNAYRLHKHVLTLHRLALPTREIVTAILNRSQPPLPGVIIPYFQDVYDHTLRVTDWSDTLRDLVSTVIDTNLSIQSNNMNLVMKKLSGWAAIIAVPTLITGYFGMNVPYPTATEQIGVIISGVLIALSSVGLYIMFKKNNWL
ncbi:magnesium transporter CorA family protein [Corynebacterium pacaense]|uniref:magnesium transporter CorA family protein n=1 Tax=Corynebacterium pacaense TaxID=1816684 RepID=UPI0009BC3B9A|nr:magnesium transporter CorA family protein [Corynebacterium pacaense]